VFGSLHEGATRVTLCLSSAQLSAKNFWSGRLRSLWQLTRPPGGGAASLSGQLDVAVHYFEEGNVQLQTGHSVQLSLPACDGAAALAEAALRAVRREEASYYASLETTFEELAGGAFKELRRALPVTRTRFQWEQAAHKVAGELADKERAAQA